MSLTREAECPKRRRGQERKMRGIPANKIRIDGYSAGRIIVDEFTPEPINVKSIDEGGMMRMYSITRNAVHNKIGKVAKSPEQASHYMDQLPDVDLFFGRDCRKSVCLQYGVDMVVASCNLNEDKYDENVGLFICLVKIAKRISKRRKMVERLAG